MHNVTHKNMIAYLHLVFQIILTQDNRCENYVSLSVRFFYKKIIVKITCSNNRLHIVYCRPSREMNHCQEPEVGGNSDGCYSRAYCKHSDQYAQLPVPPSKAIRIASANRLDLRVPFESFNLNYTSIL